HKSFLEETNTFDNSLPEFENFYFNLEEISSGSTTTHSDISLPDYEGFYFDDDHIEEISSGSTTTHSDISLSKYDSLSLIFRMISFLLPIGVTLLMRSSSMNSVTSYLHRSIIVSTLGICPIRSDGDVVFHLLPHGPMNSGSSQACDSVNKNKALRGRHPMLISIVQYSQKFEDSCQRILSSMFSFPQLQLGIMYPNLID
nr:hypothetical protein [Tanacetum cinerariifolium]